MHDVDEKRGRGRPLKATKRRRMKACLVSLTPELIERLDQEVEQLGLGSRSELIRALCDEYLARSLRRRERRDERGI